MGWAQAARPYAGERWWTLLLLAGAAIVCVAVAFALLAVRDLGGGLVPPRPGPPIASAALVRSRFGLPLRLQRASLISWTVGLGLAGVSYGSVGQDVRDLIGSNNAFEDVIGDGLQRLGAWDPWKESGLLGQELPVVGNSLGQALAGLWGIPAGGASEAPRDRLTPCWSTHRRFLDWPCPRAPARRRPYRAAACRG